MKVFRWVIFIIGVIGLINLNEATRGTGIIAFGCLLGIMELMAHAASQQQQKKTEEAPK